MPIASRRKLPPRPSIHTVQTWVFLFCLAAFLSVLDYINPVAIAPFFALFVVGGLAGIWESRRQAKIARQRLGESICTFVRSFDYRRLDTCVIRAVYEELQAPSKFPLRASDALDDDLRLDGDDLNLEIAPLLAERLGRPLVHAEANPYFGRVRTVADLVAFFCAQPPAGR